MPFAKGQSGNPAGRVKDKLMRDAISLELHENKRIEGPNGKSLKVRKLRLVARALVDAGIAGDVPAIKEINDRMDGKVPQKIGGEGENGAIPLDIKGLSDDQLGDLVRRLERALRPSHGPEE